MQRKRNDSEGWKRGEGAYSKEVKLRRDGWPMPADPGTSREGGGAYTSDADAGLVRGDDFEGSASSRQIWSDVEANQRPGGEFDSTGAIRSGVSRSQKR
jgi:hypothetical protein